MLIRPETTNNKRTVRKRERRARRDGQTKTARSPSRPSKHQSEEKSGSHSGCEETKRADPLRVKRADPQRVRASHSQRDDEHSTGTSRRCSGNRSPDQQLPTAGTKTRLRMRKKTVEVPQMHDIDKIVRCHCAGNHGGA